MSDTDIYKKREAMPMSKQPPKKRRRRSSSSPRSFDDKTRKRRSKNSGPRRLLHLFRKSENEKYVWAVMGVILIVTLVVIGIWQFFIQEYLIREEERSNDYMEAYESDIPSSDEPLISSMAAPVVEQQESPSE